MPQKIDGLTYPSTAAELVADRTLAKLVMQTFTSPEVRHRLRFLIKPPTPDRVFSEFIAPQSRTPISFPRHITQNAMDLVNEDNYEAGLWKGIFDLAEANCRQVIESDVLPAFFDEAKCETFSDHHRIQLALAAQKKFGKVSDITLRLNLTEERAVSAIILEMYRGDMKEALNFAKYAVSKAKLKVDPVEVLKAIKSGGGLTQTGSFSVDVKKLKLCGFDKPDAKVRNRVEDMVNSWMSGDKTTAKNIFQLIQKSAPRGSFLETETIESLFKTFKRYKVVGS